MRSREDFKSPVWWSPVGPRPSHSVGVSPARKALLVCWHFLLDFWFEISWMDAKQSFEDLRSQAGAWERDNKLELGNESDHTKYKPSVARPESSKGVVTIGKTTPFPKPQGVRPVRGPSTGASRWSSPGHPTRHGQLASALVVRSGQPVAHLS
ncbi:MAG TPA: hypothetical protein VGM98_01705 [Schlesneria sp.]|jgi:hypothetical protein